MDTNILKSLSSYVTPDLISKASEFLGESNQGISKGMSTSIPTLLNGLITNANDQSVMDKVMGLANNKAFDASAVLSDLPSLLTGRGNSVALDAGSSLMSSLFGKNNRVFSISSAILPE